MQGYRKTRLRCDDNLILKPKRYVWSTPRGALPRSAEPRGIWLLFKSSNEYIDATIICTVSNARRTVQGKIKVRLPGRRFYKPIPDVVGSDDSDGITRIWGRGYPQGFSSGQTEPDPESDPPYLIAIYVVVGLVVVVLVLLLCFWCYRKCC